MLFEMKSLIIGNSVPLTFAVYGLLVLVLGLSLAYRSQIAKFFSEVKTELAKCTWPWDPEQTGLRKYKTLIDSTVIVSVTALLLAGYTTGFDYVITNLISGMTRLAIHI